MSEFVRGGQTTLHSIRMLRQVLQFLVLGSFGAIAIITLIYIYSTTDAFERKIIIQYNVARFKVMLNKSDDLLQLESRNGFRYQRSAKSFSKNRIAKDIYSDFLGKIESGLYLSLCIVGITLTLIIGFFIKKGRLLQISKTVRGGAMVPSSELATMIRKDNRKHKAKSYKIAGIPFPSYLESQHTLITGSPGSGKTLAINDLLEQIRSRGDRAIIYDKMGTFTKLFYQEDKDILLNPLDKRSVSWSVFNEARGATDFDTMAEVLMPNEKGGGDPFWNKAARVIFSNVCNCLFEQGETRNRVLLDSLLKKGLGDIARMLKNTPAAAIIDEKSPKTALSVMSVLATNIGALRYLKDTENSFSIRKWVEDEKASNFMFITSRGDQHASLRPLISAWLEIAINSLLSLEQSRDRRIWVIIDELPSLHYLPSLQQGLAESRQFGGAFVISFQVMPQLQAIYGRDLALATTGLCQTLMVFKSSDPETASWGSESLGRTEVDEFKEGLSYGAHEMRDGINLNVQRHIKNLVMPTEVMNLKNLNAYIRFGQDYPISKIELKYKDRKAIAPKFVPYEVLRVVKKDSGAEVTEVPENKVKISKSKSMNTKEVASTVDKIKLISSNIIHIEEEWEM